MTEYRSLVVRAAALWRGYRGAMSARGRDSHVARDYWRRELRHTVKRLRRYTR